MGKAEDWQTRVSNRLSTIPAVGQIRNPRRADWNSSWVQSIDHPEFNTQVNWEMDNLESADIQYFYFDPTTMSPITLAELGYVLGRRGTYDHLNMHIRPDVIVCCPDGFWRKGNVEIMCDRAINAPQSKFVNPSPTGVYFFHTAEEAENALIERVWSKHKQLSNSFGYFPHASPGDSQRETKLYADVERGTKIPTGWKNEDLKVK